MRILCAGLFFWTLLVGTAWALSPELLQLLEAASRTAEAGDAVAARELLPRLRVQAAKETEPLPQEYQLLVGRTASLAGEHAAAAAYYLAADEHQPEPALVKAACAELLLAGESDRALRLAKELVDRSPADPDVWNLLAQAAQLTQRYDFAAAALSRMLEIAPEPEGDPAYQRLAALYQAAGLAGAAADILARHGLAEELDLARLYRHGGRVTAACERYKAALARDAHDGALVSEYAAYLHGLGRFQEAAGFYARAHALAPDPGLAALAETLSSVGP